MSTRNRIEVKGKHRYSERNKKGQFVDNTNIGKSTHTDSKNKSAHKVRRGHGHEGDLNPK